MITLFLNLYDRIYNFFTAAEFSRLILILKLVSWSVSLFLAFLIAMLLKRSDAAWWLRERAYARRFAYGGAPDKRWPKILARLDKGDEANLKLAVIEADNLFDEILKRMSLPGIDMAERLRQFEEHELASVNLVWEAHRLRNMIVHEPTVQISRDQAEQAIKNFEAALKELEYL
jgi:hypothetical protein